MKRNRLISGVDKVTGAIVLYDKEGNIRAWIADGKLDPPRRRESECDACTKANMAFARELAGAWNDLEFKRTYNPCTRTQEGEKQ